MSSLHDRQQVSGILYLHQIHKSDCSADNDMQVVMAVLSEEGMAVMIQLDSNDRGQLCMAQYAYPSDGALADDIGHRK